MKILQVLNQFLPKQKAGTEVYTWALSKQLINSGFEVKVVTPNFEVPYTSNYIFDDIYVHQYPEISRVDRRLIIGFSKPEGLRFFKEFIVNEKPDIVHFHELTGSNGIGIEHIKIVKDLGIKVVITFHLVGYSCKSGTLMLNYKENCDGKIETKKCSLCYLNHKEIRNFGPLLYSISKFLYQINVDSRKWNHSFGTALGTVNIINEHLEKLMELYNYCDSIVCLNEWFKDILALNGVQGSKIKVIHQGLPYKGDLPLQREEKRNNASKLKLIFLGRITRVKGLHVLIEALTDIEDKCVELDIYGNSDGSSYEEELKRKSLTMKNVNWKGVIEPNKVLETMRNYDLLCLCSSICEMSPLVIQEARSVGLPVLVSNVKGNLEQIQAGQGLEFQVNDHVSLRAIIEKIIVNREILSDIKAKMLEPIGFDVVSKQYEELYSNLIS